ncbi:F-box/kelch-repeat protein At3g27150-like [Macadamia integrifolia]|uniref:F-box/kelch-repeat protein At3g27150-like n=1 Tax=Macadamia integrifolia TaxID=60698 RepID=UPI001C4EAFC2|nr:F-box/kelch-repeat protein At3g27150-like [Macadamia integrifolia]XP_042497291.1 F-box/kelch-repeat protein At3g27150-like [Macadamia integrifolia]
MSNEEEAESFHSRDGGTSYETCVGFSSNQGGDDRSSDAEPQDADYSYVSSLNDELALLILARIPRSEHRKFCSVNKRYLALFKSDELYDIRKDYKIKEASVFMLACGEPHWWEFDRRFTSCRKLPVLPSDACFASGDKESLCAGTHLLVSGREFEGMAIWRYELVSNRWSKGPSMINPRCLFASASCGDMAFVAGGIAMRARGTEILNTAEKYNPGTKSWVSLPRMNQRRRLCSGCFMDKKFYVLGGQNEGAVNLTCGEFYDSEKNTWELIPNMLDNAPVLNPITSRSPPLVAVVNNELYSLEPFSNQLMVYLKDNKSWKCLGESPVRADQSRGWGVAFKSLGDALLIIGGTSPHGGNGMTIYTCFPDPNFPGNLEWRFLGNGGNRMSHFILNCSVMVA